MSRSARGLVALLLVLALGPHLSGRAQPAAEIRAYFDVGSPAPEVREVYVGRGYAPLWLDGGRPSAAARVLLETIREAGTHGLDPASYHRERIERGFATGTLEAEAAGLDVLLTEALLRYGRHMVQGRVAPQVLHPGWNVAPRSVEPVTTLLRTTGQSVVDARRLRTLLAWLVPAHEAYGWLRQALFRYRGLAHDGGWPVLRGAGVLRKGDVAPEVRTLRERLHITADLPSDAPDSAAVFDAALEDAVRAFQARHGLRVDGVVGPKTRAVLNVPVEARVRQLTTNMERWRWLPERLGARYVLVQVAGYSLEVFEEDQRVLEMRAIVGTPRTPTPLFSAPITEVVLAPYWYVPESIARNEIRPRLSGDPGYLARHHMTVLSDGTIRQAPGPTNPLGRIKFIVPNPFGIRLHDTPGRHLFEEDACAFSHGCLRLEKPIELAVYLLRDDADWPLARIEEAIARWKQVSIAVPTPVQLYVLYGSAWGDKEGRVHFRPDVYGHDAALARLF